MRILLHKFAYHFDRLRMTIAVATPSRLGRGAVQNIHSTGTHSANIDGEMAKPEAAGTGRCNCPLRVDRPTPVVRTADGDRRWLRWMMRR